MHSHVRSLVILTLFAGGAIACASSDTPVTMMKVTGPPTPTFGRVRATDSTMTLTDEEYSDAAPVLMRRVPLDTDLTVSAVIGPRGGELRLDAAGVRVVFPAGAVRTATTLSMTAIAGEVVAYDFQPHTQFYLPVMIQQDIALTTSEVSSLPRFMYGGYYGTTLDSSFVDATRTRVKVHETQLGYVDVARKQIKIFVGHFSGYILATRKTTAGE
jgi:hypothetical protein